LFLSSEVIVSGPNQAAVAGRGDLLASFRFT
jgi:hypothetical protein